MLQLDTTYEELVDQKLDDALSKDRSLDTREGSILFNAFAINSIEIIQMLQTIIANSNEAFADTASRPNLIKRAAERGLKPLVATKALRSWYQVKMKKIPKCLERAISILSTQRLSAVIGKIIKIK